ncbi:MAG: hypothetical protein II660_08190, partial [Bacteroidales bacterium]|nr:hypothetical protein [Bacteroidales bacterium]
MDVGQLAEMIRELVPCSEEIALPGLGVFVVEEVPAAFSDRGYTVNPPYLRLAFRQKSSEDNSLVNLYAKKKSISQKEAATILGGFFKRLAAVLKDKKSVNLPGMGRLRATNENIFFFVQNEDIDIYPQGFGLESISLKTLTSPADDEDLLLELVDDEPVEEIPDQVGDDREAVGDDREVVGEDKAGVGALRIVLWSVLGLVVLFFALLAILGRVAPQLVDPLLYNSQEL